MSSDPSSCSSMFWVSYLAGLSSFAARYNSLSMQSFSCSDGFHINATRLLATSCWPTWPPAPPLPSCGFPGGGNARFDLSAGAFVLLSALAFGDGVSRNGMVCSLLLRSLHWSAQRAAPATEHLGASMRWMHGQSGLHAERPGRAGCGVWGTPMWGDHLGLCLSFSSQGVRGFLLSGRLQL